MLFFYQKDLVSAIPGLELLRVMQVTLLNEQATKKASHEALSFDRMYGELHAGFSQVKDHRSKNSSYALADIVSAAFAMFSLKSASLLDFSLRSRQEDTNLLAVYKIEKLCSDTQMREVLDQVSTDEVRNLFKKVLESVQKSDFCFLSLLEGVGSSKH